MARFPSAGGGSISFLGGFFEMDQQPRFAARTAIHDPKLPHQLRLSRPILSLRLDMLEMDEINETILYAT